MNLGELRDMLKPVSMNMDLFRFMQEDPHDSNDREHYWSTTQKIGDLICQELGVTHDDAVNLPDDTELPPVANEKAEALREWLGIQMTQRQTIKLGAQT